LVDVWGRWDAGWYFDLIENGYYARGDLETVQSNLAFLPLFPDLVKGLVWLAPAGLRSAGLTLLAGVLVSNGFLFGALVLLHRLTLRLTGEPGAAQRAVLYLLVFPTSFFLSSFYTEATFLFFALAAFYAAERRAWAWAALAGAALTLTRLPGILAAVPLGLMYLQAAKWRWRNLRADLAWFLLMPLSLLAFFYWQYTLTGEFPATLIAQQAWARAFGMPWESLGHAGTAGYLTPVERALTVVFAAGSVWALWRWRSPAYGLFALTIVAPPLFTGSLLSTLRFYLLAFPVFMLAGQLGRRSWLHQALVVGGAVLLGMYFAAWCRFFWVA
jgi:hypothetical protein